jgi:hypothetical protein
MRFSIVCLLLALAGCFGDDDANHDAGSPADPDAGSPSTRATCNSVCNLLVGACGAEVRGCILECGQDQSNAESCGQADAWQELLDCCAEADYPAGCDESFDGCPKDACGERRPSGAADGC